jgi:hypothetical protein
MVNTAASIVSGIGIAVSVVRAGRATFDGEIGAALQQEARDIDVVVPATTKSLNVKWW